MQAGIIPTRVGDDSSAALPRHAEEKPAQAKAGVGIHVFFVAAQRRGWWAFARHDAEKPAQKGQYLGGLVLLLAF
jgi:hypothetical protein